MERKRVQESPVDWGNQALELDKIFVGVDKHNRYLALHVLIYSEMKIRGWNKNKANRCHGRHFGRPSALCPPSRLPSSQHHGVSARSMQCSWHILGNLPVGGHHRAEAVKHILDTKCLKSCTFHNTEVDRVTLDNVGCFTHSKLEIKPVPFLPSLIYLMNSFIFEWEC